MPKNVNTALKAKAKAWTFEAKAKAAGPEAKAKAKAIKFGLEAPRGQGLASRTTSLTSSPQKCSSFEDLLGPGLAWIMSTIIGRLNKSQKKKEQQQEKHGITSVV